MEMSKAAIFHSHSTNISSRDLPSKPLLCLLVMMLQVVVGTWGEMVIKVTVPNPGFHGQPAQLECFLDMFYPNIKSIRWFLNGQEIYQIGYRVKDSFKEYENIPELDVKYASIPEYDEEYESIPEYDVKEETFIELVLASRKLIPESEEEYKCEIITGPPHDDLIFGTSANLAVVDVSYPPEIIFEKNVYTVGDTLNATCVARYSSPASILDLRVNGNTIPPESGQVKNIKIAPGTPPGLYTTTRQFTMPLSCSHEGSLNITCKAHVLTAVLENTIEIQVGPARSSAGVPRSTSISPMIVTAVLMLVLLCYQW